MPLKRQRELPLAKPLSLKQFVDLMMPHPNLVRSPLCYKTDLHPINTSSNSDFDKPHAAPHDHLMLNANILMSVKPFAGTEMPVNSGEDLF